MGLLIKPSRLTRAPWPIPQNANGDRAIHNRQHVWEINHQDNFSAQHRPHGAVSSRTISKMPQMLDLTANSSRYRVTLTGMIL
jgi:hypothetical protein